jgi:hypothetical protein
MLRRCSAHDAAYVDRPDSRFRLGAGHQHGLLTGARRGGGAAAAVAAPPVPVGAAPAPRPALAHRIRGRDRGLAHVRGGAAAGAAFAGAGRAVLAFATARGHPSRLARREQGAVILAIAGLTLLAFSLVDTAESDQRPVVVGVIVWLAACGGGAALLIATPTRFGRAASLGLAAGLLFADGDISAKLVGYGGLWLIAIGSLIVAYAVGTSVLQWAYQRGDALTAAGMATMATNAVPIAAGFVLFGEALPTGMPAVVQIAAFACLVASAVALGRPQPPQADQAAPRDDGLEEGTAEESGRLAPPPGS